MDIRLDDGTIIRNVPDGMTKEQVQAKVDAKRARDTGTSISDYARALASGVNRIGSSLAGMADNSKIGDMVRMIEGTPTREEAMLESGGMPLSKKLRDAYLAKLTPEKRAEIEKAAAEYAKANPLTERVRKFFDSNAGYWNSGMTEGAKAKRAYVGEGSDIVDTLRRYKNEPQAALLAAVENTPQIGLAMATKNAPASSRAVINAGVEAAMNGEDARQGVLDDASKKFFADGDNWSNLKGVDPAAAIIASNEAEKRAMAATLALSPIGAASEIAALRRLGGQAPIQGAEFGLKQIPKQTWNEAVEEFGQESLSKAAQNKAIADNYDPSVGLLDGAGVAGVHGAVAGGVMGAGRGMLMVPKPRSKTGTDTGSGGNPSGSSDPTQDQQSAAMDELRAAAEQGQQPEQPVQPQNMAQPAPAPQEPASGLSGVVQRAQTSTAPNLATVLSEAIASGQTPDFSALAQAYSRTRAEVVGLFNRRRTLVDLADAGDLNGMRDMAARMTADPQEQQSLIEQAVAVRDKRRTMASQPQPTQQAEPQQPATPIKTPRDTAYEKMLADAEASLASGASDVDTFLAVRKKYAGNKDLVDTDINGVIDDAKASLSGKREVAAKREAAIESAIPHLKAGDEVSAVTALADAGITDDADIQAVFKEANSRLKAKPAAAQAKPQQSAQPAVIKSPMEQAVEAVSKAQEGGKGVKLATIAKKYGVGLVDLARQVAAAKTAPINTKQPEERKVSPVLALPAPKDAPVPADQPLVSRRGKLLPKAQADAMAEQSAAEKRDMRRAMSEEAGNPTGVPSGLRPRVEAPARAPQKAVLPDVILRTDGKPFPNEAEATRAMNRKGAQETHEVAPAPQGAGVVVKRRQANVIDVEKDDILAAIAKSGGVNWDQALKQGGFDPAESGRRGSGILRVFKKNGGMTLDGMAEHLSQFGYPVTDENGDYTVNALLDAMDTALRGGQVGTAQFNERLAREMYEKEAELRALDDALDGGSSSDMPSWLDDGADALAESVIDGETQPSAVLADALNEVENERTIASPAAGTGQKTESGAEAGAGQGSNAPTAGPREGGQQEGKGGAGQDSGVQAGLAGNWIGADRFFETIATEEYGPAPRGEAIGFIKSSPAGTTALETVVRPSGKRVHFLLLSGGSGEYAQDFASPEKTIGSIVASLQKDIDGRKKRFDEQQRKLNDAQANEKAVAERNKYQAGVNLGDITPNTGKMLRASRIVVDNGDGTFDVEGTAGNKTARIRGMSASSIERAVKRAKGQDDFSLLGQTEAERFAEEQRQAAMADAQRKEEESARLKAQADREISSFTLTGSDRPADVAMAAGQKDLFGPRTRGEKEAEKSQPKADATISDSDYAQVVEAAKYLKDIVYSMDNLVGDDTDLLIALSSDLGKSGRDTILMDAFGIDRSLAHTINNRLDDRKPHKLRAVDMGDAFTTFPMLRKVVDDAKDVIRKRGERRAARDAESKAASQQAKDATTDTAESKPEPVREMTEEGRAKDGKPIIGGDKFRTSSGRETTPYPHQKSEEYASQWLIDNATAEAEARGDDFNAPIFRRTTLRKNGTLTDADRDSMLMYLFGEQPRVVPSILKPLIPDLERAQAIVQQPASQSITEQERALLQREAEKQRAAAINLMTAGESMKSAGIEFEEDGPRTRITRNGIPIGSLEGKRDRDTVLRVLQRNHGDDESMQASLKKKAAKTMDLMSDSEIEGIYAKAGIAGKNLPVEAKREVLKQEEPQGILDLIAASKRPQSTQDNIRPMDSQKKDGLGVTRLRTKDAVIFDAPYTGKDGNKLTGYDWKNREEHYTDARGNDRVRLVSDWDQATTNDETGRDIVHHFIVEDKDGNESIVSAETAADLLGISEREVRQKAQDMVDEQANTKKQEEENAQYIRELGQKRLLATPSDAVDHALRELSPLWNKRISAIKQGVESGDDYQMRQKMTFITRDGKYIFAPAGADGAVLSGVGWDLVEIPASKVFARAAQDDNFDAFARRLGQGKVTIDEFKRRFDDLTANKDAVMAELSAKTKDQLLSGMGPMKAARYRNDKKDAIVRAAYSDMLTEFALHKSLTYGMDGPEPAVRRMVADMTEADLAEYASRVAERRKEIDEARKNYANALENPQSMEDYRAYIRAKREGGMTYREAFLSLNPEQREKYDALEAEATKTRREEHQRAEKTRIEAAQQKTGASIVETKHTQKGHDLFVVKLDDRVDRDSYNTLNAAAKRLGGYYSSYRAGGAVPGFQFTERSNAEAFSKLVQGDTTQAKEAINEKRDAFEDNKAQSAADRLDEMAQRLEETADAALNAERKTNTSRRARFADAAMREAYAQQAMAKTMRNLSESIRSGSAKFLGMVRQKVQIETLNRLVASAHENYLKDKYKENWYSKREEPVTKASSDHADFPTFTAWKSDLATLGRQLMQIPGAKRIGEALTKTADDVTEDYLAFARENIQKVSHFRLKDGTGAVFSSKESAENAIYKSGLSDRAIVLPVKRGENRIILSPKAAADLGVWRAEDKRITLKPDFADELVGKMTEYPKQVTQLHGLLSAKERIDRLKGMGIETPTELRAALREYIGLKEEAKRDKIKEMELSMVGRQNDGLDFFPTPEATVDRMIEEADIKPGMSVLEPEAGMGHIADRLREAGHEPEVMEISPSRRELLLAKGYRFPVEGEGDFTKVMPRTFHTFGDTFKAPDGTVGIMRGQGGMGSDRVRLDDEQGNTLGYYSRDELTPVGHRGSASGYDRIIMNPPFSNRQDAAHVMHAYDHLADGGRLVAIVGEGVFNGSDAKAVKFREWLSEHGARIEKLDAGTFNDPSLPVTTQANARIVVIDKKSAPNIGKDDVRFSIDDQESLNFAADFLAQLADSDEIFRYPVSSAKSLRAIMAEVFPEASYAGDDTRPDERSESGADKRTLFRTELGKLFHVYEHGDQVWIDVSKLNEGDKGSGVYAAVGNYAHNNRKVFVGDPAGLSEAAVVRRSNAMLSLALRFGSTDFMEAAKEQVAGDPENGIAPLNWRGSDLDKITALIDTVLQNMHNNIPGLKDGYRYDFAKRGFFDRLGRPVGLERIADAGRLGVSRAARAGSRTLRRGILLQSLVSSPGSQRPGILEQVLRRGGALGFARNGLDGVFSASNSEASSDSLTTSRAREILSADPVLSKALPFIDIRNSKEGVPEGADPMYLPAWHGSPYKFDKFSLEHLGKGEGVQAYGWGLYFAGSKGVAEYYKNTLSSPNIPDGKVLFNGVMYDYSGADEKSINRLIDAVQSKYGFSRRVAAIAIMGMREHGGATMAKTYFMLNMPNKTEEQRNAALLLAVMSNEALDAPSSGALYKVDIPDEGSYLLWDAPASKQSSAVKNALLSRKADKHLKRRAQKNKNLFEYLGETEMSGRDVYEALSIGLGSPEKASKFLMSMGISGIKYLDGSSRAKGDGNYNYVIFDDNAVRILETHYSTGDAGAEGYYHNGRITLFADNIRATGSMSAEERLKWVAFHEITHRGVANLAESQAYLSELERAGKNPYVKNLAKKIYEARQELDEKYHVSMEVAAEEALAEINAALRTGNVKQIKEQYGLHFPLSIRPRAKSAAARFIEVVKRIINRMFGRGLTDAQIENLLRRTNDAGMTPDGGPGRGRGYDAAVFSLADKGDGSPTEAALAEARRQLDEQLAIADRMIAERGGLFAPNGEKSKLNRHQWAQVRTANFKRWFGDWEGSPANSSKVVDANGEPLVVYHGTTAMGFNEFKPKSAEAYGLGSYFASDRTMPEEEFGVDGRVIEAFLNIRNPSDGSMPKIRKNSEALKKLRQSRPRFRGDEYDAFEEYGDFRGEAIREAGHDGIIAENDEYETELVVFKPSQIKSATSNAGTFSGNANDIRYSPSPKDWITEQGRITKRVLSKEVAQRDLTLWQKTLGTQLNAALKNPAFKKVYDLTQRLIQHVNNDAYDSLNAAPDVLSRLEDWNDYKRDLTNTAKEAGAALTMQQSKRRKDMAAAAEVLFEGTRFDKKVYSDEELDAFKLTADQKEIYRQARAAIDKSVGNAGKSQALNVAMNAEAINWATVERLVNLDLDPEVLFSEVSDLIDARIAATKMEAENSTNEAEIKKLDKQAEKLAAALASIGEIQAIVEKSATEGYAPLMRWGKYTVAVIDPVDGKTLRFHMLESKREQAALELKLREKYGVANVVGGVLDEGKFEQFKGITPETVALFASVTGMDQDAAYQEYLKLAIPGRSALKRKIHRKGDMGEGIEGFSTDLPRVLSSFVLSNARKSARDLYRGPINDAIKGIKVGGGVAAKARELAEFVLEPDENDWSVGIRNLLFVWNMGASVAFGVLNLSQPWMMTLPWLSQFQDPASAAGVMAKAAKLAASAQASGKAPKGYEAEYSRAVREGIVDPQNVFMLQGVERGKSGVGTNIWRNVAHGMGLIASATESMNRKLTLIAALDVARAKGDDWLKSKGFADAYEFAARSVAETQGVYNKGNRPAWARNPALAVILVFKQYSINWVEMASRMASNHYGDDRYRKGFWMLVGALFMMAGGMGLPFADDLIDLIESGMSWAGKPVNIERQMQMALGKDLYEPLMNGPVNSLLFNPMGADMFGRMSMGNMIPATAVANPGLTWAARSDEAVQALGAGAGLASKFVDAYNQAASGNVGQALITASPRAVTSIAKAAEMTATGQYKDSKGRTVRSVTPAEALIKGLDLQPASVARIQRERGRRFKDEAIQAQARTEIRNTLIDAYESGDQDAIDAANNRLRTWNDENPLYPVHINRRALRKTVRERGKNWSARDEAAKGMEWMNDWIPESSK